MNIVVVVVFAQLQGTTCWRGSSSGKTRRGIRAPRTRAWRTETTTRSRLWRRKSWTVSQVTNTHTQRKQTHSHSQFPSSCLCLVLKSMSCRCWIWDTALISIWSEILYNKGSVLLPPSLPPSLFPSLPPSFLPSFPHSLIILDFWSERPKSKNLWSVCVCVGGKTLYNFFYFNIPSLVTREQPCPKSQAGPQRGRVLKYSGLVWQVIVAL